MPFLSHHLFSVSFQSEQDYQEYERFLADWRSVLQQRDNHSALVLNDQGNELTINCRWDQWLQWIALFPLEKEQPLAAPEKAQQAAFDKTLLDEKQQGSQSVGSTAPDSTKTDAINPIATGWANVVLGSRYFQSMCLRHPDDVLMAFYSFHSMEKIDQEGLEAFFRTLVQLPTDQPLWQVFTDQASLDDALRRFRRVLLCRFIWCEFTAWVDLESRMQAWSLVADFCLQTALDWHYHTLAVQWGVPVDDAGLPQPLMVLSLGKLGALELNLSSDIDLMFVFPCVAPLNPTNAKRQRERTSAEFFHRVGQSVIQSLDRMTPQGFVFRVDMRLRPYGNSGALVSSLASIEQYYQTQGREWERFAMIKARVSAITQVDTLMSHSVESEATSHTKHAIEQASDTHQQNLWEILRPFSYRRYVDYSAINALRDLKALIQREVRRKGMDDDVKLGWGGIREIEFIAQVFQLIRGGRDTGLQERRLLAILPKLAELQCLPVDDVQKLTQAYYFLRYTEHVIQAWEDRQTQTLPSTQEAQARMAWVMGFSGWPDFIHELSTHRQAVHGIFQQVIEDDAPDVSRTDGVLAPFWRFVTQMAHLPSDHPDDAQVISAIDSYTALFSETSKETGFKVCDVLWQCLNNGNIQRMGELARERFDRLMINALNELARTQWPQTSDSTFGDHDGLMVTLERLTTWSESVAGRSSYFVLLSENPDALSRFLRLLSVSPWIAELLRAHPILLEEMLSGEQGLPSKAFQIPTREALGQSLRQQLLRIPDDDEEQKMEALRFFRLSHSLRVASAELTESLPLMKVSDYLTWLAETILEEVLQHAWQQMSEKYGTPPDCSGVGADKGFVIIGYGKLGGLEMSHQSDLDLVFIYRGDRQSRTQGAERSLDIPTFYTRLGQKIIHFLTTRTWLGRLYEVDMRLRPSGNSGMLVTRWEAFDQYQRDSAWTWEHQALVRARPVAGCPELSQAFHQLRSDVLGAPRHLEDLKQSVVDMRHKMRTHLGSSKKASTNTPKLASSGPEYFHLKHDDGGIVDIEFMVQYAVLAWAAQEPKLLVHTDNIRLLETLDALQRLPGQSARQLIDAYQALRRLGHRLALQQRSLLLSDDLLTAERQQVITAWRGLLLGDAQ